MSFRSQQDNTSFFVNFIQNLFQLNFAYGEEIAIYI